MILIYRFCLIASCLLLVTSPVFTQVCTPSIAKDVLEVNGVRTDITNIGLLWEGKYEVPAPVVPQGTTPSALYSCGLMVAGKNASGTLKIAAQLSLDYGGYDFFPGPLDSAGKVSPATCTTFDWVFNITRRDISDFRNSNGSLISDNMKRWPAKGNPYFRAITGYNLPNQNLAPFVDVNRDGIYNPQNGDYPDFCGGFAYWWVFNDKGNAHTSSKGGTPLGIEVLGTAYVFADSDSAFYYSTFYNYEIIYKGTETLDSAYVALWIDPDLGCNEDDYIGCSPSNNMAYVYNSDATDGSVGAFCQSSDKRSYGTTKLPVVGIKLLQTPKGANDQELGMTNFMYYYTVPGTYPAKAGLPTTPNDFYNYMTSRWRDGSPLTSGGEGTSTANATTKFAYSAPPTNITDWNMPNSSANTLEKAMIMSCGPFQMLPNSRHKIAFAVVADLDVTHPRPNITNLINRANGLKNVCTFATATTTIPDESASISIVPNPVSNEAQLIYSGFINNVAIFNLTGQLIKETKEINSNILKFSTQDMNAGIYVYRMTDSTGKSISGRFSVVK